MVLLSFLLPTRGRFSLCKESIESLFNLAYDKLNIEVLMAMDNDDTDTIFLIEQYINTSTYKEQIKLFKFDRVGYKNLHIYINNLSKLALGKYCVLWNDDARMITQNYDTILDNLIKNQDKLYVYQFKNNHYPNIFPAVPKVWIDTMGHFSQNAHNDTWIEDIANALNVNKTIDINIWHLRGDDKNNAIYSSVDSDCLISSPEYFSSFNVHQRANDAQKLRESLYK